MVGLRHICRRRSARRSSGCPKASTPSDSVLMDRVVRERARSRGQTRRADGRAARPDQERSAAARRHGHRARAVADAHLVIVGEGPRPAALRAAAAALGICGRRHVRRIRAARRDARLLSGGRCVRAVVGFRQLAERRARSDGSALPVVTTDVGGVRELRRRSHRRAPRRDCRAQRSGRACRRHWNST